MTTHRWKALGQYLLPICKSILFWKAPVRIQSHAQLISFVQSHARHVSQTALFGYVKTRTGTRYTELFRDDLFVQSLNIAKWEIYLASLSDLTIFTCAHVARQQPPGQTDPAALALQVYASIVAGEPVPVERAQGFDKDIETFQTRLSIIDWRDAAINEQTFAPSGQALFHWAPIADELKQYDREIVLNSIRFKWKHIRDLFRTSLDVTTSADFILQTEF